MFHFATYHVKRRYGYACGSGFIVSRTGSSMPFRWPLRCRAAAAAPHTSDSMTKTPEVLREGPYVWSVVTDHITSVRPTGHHQQHEDTRPVKLPLFVTVPMVTSPTADAPSGPFPVCVLLNGFQVRTCCSSSTSSSGNSTQWCCNSRQVAHVSQVKAKCVLNIQP